MTDCERTEPPKTGRAGTVSRCVAGVRQFISDAMSRSALRGELAALERNGSLDAVLADVGLDRLDLETMARGYPESERLLPAMAGRLGVELDGLDARSKSALNRTCALCRAHRVCRRWLAAEHDKSEKSEKSERHVFCPNAELFDALLAKRPH